MEIKWSGLSETNYLLFIHEADNVDTNGGHYIDDVFWDAVGHVRCSDSIWIPPAWVSSLRESIFCPRVPADDAAHATAPAREHFFPAIELRIRHSYAEDHQLLTKQVRRSSVPIAGNKQLVAIVQKVMSELSYPVRGNMTDNVLFLAGTFPESDFLLQQICGSGFVRMSARDSVL